MAPQTKIGWLLFDFIIANQAADFFHFEVDQKLGAFGQIFIRGKTTSGHLFDQERIGIFRELLQVESQSPITRAFFDEEIDSVGNYLQIFMRQTLTHYHRQAAIFHNVWTGIDRRIDAAFIIGRREHANSFLFTEIIF